MRKACVRGALYTHKTYFMSETKKRHPSKALRFSYWKPTLSQGGCKSSEVWQRSPIKSDGKFATSAQHTCVQLGIMNCPDRIINKC